MLNPHCLLCLVLRCILPHPQPCFTPEATLSPFSDNDRGIRGGSKIPSWAHRCRGSGETHGSTEQGENLFRYICIKCLTDSSVWWLLLLCEVCSVYTLFEPVITQRSVSIHSSRASAVERKTVPLLPDSLRTLQLLPKIRICLTKWPWLLQMGGGKGVLDQKGDMESSGLKDFRLLLL